MDKINFFSFPPLISGILILFLGIFVLQKRRRANIHYFILCFVTFVWLFFYGLAFLQKEDSYILRLLFKIGYGGVVFICTCWFKFIVEFLEAKKLNRLANFCYIISFFTLFYLLFTDGFIIGVKKYFWGYYPITKGSLYHPVFLFFYSTLWVIGVVLLYRSIKLSASPLEILQRKYLLLSLLIVLPGIIDFVPNYGIQIYPFAWFLVAMCILFTSYTILKYNLLDIKIVITRVSVFLVVYFFVLFLPFYIGYKTNSWVFSTTSAVVLATIGPFIYSRLRLQIENRIKAEELHAHQLLKEAARGIILIHTITSYSQSRIGNEFG
ncbi:MAG: hypothetical protein NC935_08900 [Candidatus Omnitrophica bacterium]|nr:hypothetical protein [Candidatus Omnitrophota bacterium]